MINDAFFVSSSNSDEITFDSPIVARLYSDETLHYRRLRRVQMDRRTGLMAAESWWKLIVKGDCVLSLQVAVAGREIVTPRRCCNRESTSNDRRMTPHPSGIVVVSIPVHKRRSGIEPAGSQPGRYSRRHSDTRSSDRQLWQLSQPAADPPV